MRIKELKIPVLVYHYFGKDRNLQAGIEIQDLNYIVLRDDFMSHIRYLHEQGYQAISFRQMMNARQGLEALPPKPVILTFDDGHQSVYDFAIPILCKYKLQAEIFVAPLKIGTSGYMSWNQLEELVNEGFFIQSHTNSHVLLSKLSQDDIKYELVESKKGIETRLNVTVTALAVPMGGYPRILKTIAREAGYKFVCTSYYGINSIDSDFLYLKRIMIKSPNDKINDLQDLLMSKSFLSFKMRIKNGYKYLRNNLFLVSY